MLRKEFDIGKIERMIKNKADLSEFNAANENLQFKLQALDSNFGLIVKDFQTFQKAVNNMHYSIMDL